LKCSIARGINRVWSRLSHSKSLLSQAEAKFQVNDLLTGYKFQLLTTLTLSVTLFTSKWYQTKNQAWSEYNQWHFAFGAMLS